MAAGRWALEDDGVLCWAARFCVVQRWCGEGRLLHSHVQHGCLDTWPKAPEEVEALLCAGVCVYS